MNKYILCLQFLIIVIRNKSWFNVNFFFFIERKKTMKLHHKIQNNWFHCLLSMYVKTWEFSIHFTFSLFFCLQLDLTDAKLDHNNSQQKDVRFTAKLYDLFILLFEFLVNSVYSKVLDLGSLFSRYPSYGQRPIYGGYGGYGNGGYGSGGYGNNNFYPGGLQSGGGYYPNSNGNFYPGSSGLGTNFLGLSKQMIFKFENIHNFVHLEQALQTALDLLVATVDMVDMEVRFTDRDYKQIVGWFLGMSLLANKKISRNNNKLENRTLCK